MIRGPIVRRMFALMGETGAIMLALVVFATTLAITLAESLLDDDANIALYFIILIVALVAQTAAWWVSARMLAGDARGTARLGKWILYTIGYGLLISLPSGIFGFVAAANMEALNQSYLLMMALVTSALAAALIFIMIRITALSISGDRIRFAAIRQGLSRHFPLLAALAFCLMIPGQLSAYFVDVETGWLGEFDHFAVAAVSAALAALSVMAQMALFVSAYLEVDRYADEAAVRDTFG